MDHRPVHLHSMLVHAAIALAPLSAGAFVLETSSLTVVGIGPAVWAFLFRGSLIGMLVFSLPSIVTGIAERNHMYVNWPPSHRIKLTLSLVLVILVGFELATVFGSVAPLQLGSLLAIEGIGGVTFLSVLCICHCLSPSL